MSENRRVTFIDQLPGVDIDDMAHVKRSIRQGDHTIKNCDSPVYSSQHNMPITPLQSQPQFNQENLLSKPLNISKDEFFQRQMPLNFTNTQQSTTTGMFQPSFQKTHYNQSTTTGMFQPPIEKNHYNQTTTTTQKPQYSQSTTSGVFQNQFIPPRTQYNNIPNQDIPILIPNQIEQQPDYQYPPQYYYKHPNDNMQRPLILEGYQQPQQPSCRDLAYHIDDCPLCSRFYSTNDTFYYIIIAILIMVIVFLLIKLFKKKLN